MLETKLLDLIAEYVEHDATEAVVMSVGLERGRSKDEIAAEYGQVLKQFLTS